MVNQRSQNRFLLNQLEIFLRVLLINDTACIHKCLRKTTNYHPLTSVALRRSLVKIYVHTARVKLLDANVLISQSSSSYRVSVWADQVKAGYGMRRGGIVTEIKACLLNVERGQGGSPTFLLISPLFLFDRMRAIERRSVGQAKGVGFFHLEEIELSYSVLTRSMSNGLQLLTRHPFSKAGQQDSQTLLGV